MTKNLIVVIADYSHQSPMTLEEICNICQIKAEFIHELIEFGVITPAGDTENEWLFNMNHLQRIKTAVRLRRDLEVNLAGVAVILDLLDEMEQLRARNEFFEKHFF
jgi:chaperone modulatory protein CbpM